MPVEIPTGPRYKVAERPGELTISIPAKRYWYVIPFICIWLCFWVIGEAAGLGFIIGGIGGYFEKDGNEGAMSLLVAFSAAWLTGWTLGGIAAVYMVLWQIAGREVISIDGLVLRILVHVPCWTRSKEYRLEDVKVLRLVPMAMLPWPHNAQFAHSFPLARGAGLIAFDYGAKTIRFGISLEEAEAKMLLSDLGRRYPGMMPAV